MTTPRMRATAHYIASVQHPDGAIPWFAGGIIDPWDHVEAAMGLTVAGYVDQARAAYRWLARHQEASGAWFAAYDESGVIDAGRVESNFVAYPATGCWHHYLVTRDRAFLAECWPMVEAAIEFVLELQSPYGEIYWARDSRTGISFDALVTGCSAIFKSLDSASRIAETLGRPRPAWEDARTRLGHALRERPERFDRTWESKRHYSMDWFYPVLCGVLRDNEARHHLRAHWARFVVPGHGCRCVADRPWVTVAESCELVMALHAAGEHRRARQVFSWLERYNAEDGSWWTGYEYDAGVYWPEERPTWTAGAVLLAEDTLAGHTPAAGFFSA